MKVNDIFEEAMPKKRPPKTLWFQDYNLWVLDIKSRFPDAQAHNVDEDEEEIVAVDSGGAKCYGRWSNKQKRGVSFFGGRPRVATIGLGKTTPRQG